MLKKTNLHDRQNPQVVPQILDSKMEGLSVADADLMLYIHPSQSKEVRQAIINQLSSLLFKFNEDFDGMLLAYDVSMVDQKMKILSGVYPYSGVTLKANLLLFSPKPDMLLEGKAVKISEEWINMTVLGFSSAVITAENIREEFEYELGSEGEEQEEDPSNRGLYLSRSNKHHILKVGTMIRFTVKSLDEESMHIYGSLMRADTGSIHFLHKNSIDSPSIKRSLGVGVIEPNHGQGDSAPPSSNNRQGNRSKKRRIVDNQE